MTETPMTAPTKVCPNCQVQAQTTSDKCPNCGKKYKKRRGGGFLKALVIGIILLVLLIAGCTALLAGGASEVADEIDRQQNENAITRSEFDSISLGDSQDDIEADYGEPADSQDFENEGILDQEPSNSSCIYYNLEDGDFGDLFQLCFTEGRLTSKNAY